MMIRMVHRFVMARVMDRVMDLMMHRFMMCGVVDRMMILSHGETSHGHENQPNQ
ncbi:MAG TPA: hypothetical protein VG101_07435 [Puia sp.]|jgi:hypothetical protein|nr:hypothetical protein [Puia sp.]